MIFHLTSLKPTWLLFDADWMHTRQSAIFQKMLKKVVSIGRIKWIKDSKSTGKDNCCWYLFDEKFDGNYRILRKNRMKQKKLEKGSVWEKADANGDGVVTDQEMAMRERMVLLRE